MNNVWISTDWHLWSDNIDYAHPRRGARSIGKLSDQFAAHIREDDLFVFLGDLCDPEAADTRRLESILKSVPCYKILCKGNHDTMDDGWYTDLGFDEVCDILKIHNIVFSHMPVRIAPDEINIHGHLHTEKMSALDYRYVNAYAADWNTNDAPVLLEDLLEKATKQEKEFTDNDERKNIQSAYEKYTSVYGDKFAKVIDHTDWFSLSPPEDEPEEDIPAVPVTEASRTPVSRLSEAASSACGDTWYILVKHGTDIRKGISPNMGTNFSLLKYPPYAELGSNTRELLKNTDTYKVQLSMVPGISSVSYGEHGPDWLRNVSTEEYFKDYNDASPEKSLDRIDTLVISVSGSKLPTGCLSEYDPDTVITGPETLEAIFKFNQRLNRDYKYGVNIGDKIVIDTGHNNVEQYMDQYHVMRPEEFEHSKGGICWDYTAYEADYFRKHFPDIQFDTYFIAAMNPKSKALYRTHSFLVFSYEHELYYFESAFYAIRGVYAAPSIKDIVRYVVTSMDKDNKGQLPLMDLYVTKYDATDPRQFGMTQDQYITWAMQDGQKYSDGYSTEYDITRLTEKDMHQLYEATVAADFYGSFWDSLDEVIFDDPEDAKYFETDDVKWKEKLDKAEMDEDAAELGALDRDSKSDVAYKYGLRPVGNTHEAEDEYNRKKAEREKEEAAERKKKQKQEAARKAREAQEKKREAKKKAKERQLKALAKGRKTQKKKRIIRKIKSHLPKFNHSKPANEDADAVDSSEADWLDTVGLESNLHHDDFKRIYEPRDRYKDAFLETALNYKFELIDHVQFFDRVDEAAANDPRLYPVYVILMHSGTVVSQAIKIISHAEYSHAAISFDSSMKHMYSFCRKQSGNPFIGGFNWEDLHGDFYKGRPDIPYALYVVPSTRHEINLMKKRLDFFIQNESKFTFDFIGLFKNYFGIVDNPEYRYFCSRFVSDILNAGRPDDPYVAEPSLMDPQDFTKTNFAIYVTGGKVKDYDAKKVDRITRTILRAEEMKRKQLQENAVFDIEPSNPWAHDVLSYQLSMMSEAAADPFMDYLQSFKVRFDAQGNIIVSRKEYDLLDSHFRKSLRAVKAAEASGDIDAVKNELYRINCMIDLINKYYLGNRTKNLRPNSKDVKSDMTDLRADMMTALQTHMNYVQTRDGKWNFAKAYAGSSYGKNRTAEKLMSAATGKTLITPLN